MTREEQLDWLYRLRTQITVYMPKEWVIPMYNALDMAIKEIERKRTEEQKSKMLHRLEADAVIVAKELRDKQIR